MLKVSIYSTNVSGEGTHVDGRVAEWIGCG